MVISFKTFLIAAVPIWIIFRIFRIKKSVIKLGHETAVNLLFIYLMYLAQMTIFPLNIFIPLERNINLIPFKTIMEFIPNLLEYGLITNSLSPHLNAGAINIVGNIVVFIPVGLLLPLANDRAGRFKAVLLLGFALSLAIEILQFLFVEGRRMDVDDLLLNTLGIVLGWVIYRAVYFLISRSKKSIRSS